jgi:hypothetical protein
MIPLSLWERVRVRADRAWLWGAEPSRFSLTPALAQREREQTPAFNLP